MTNDRIFPISARAGELGWPTSIGMTSQGATTQLPTRSAAWAASTPGALVRSPSLLSTAVSGAQAIGSAAIADDPANDLADAIAAQSQSAGAGITSDVATVPVYNLTNGATTGSASSSGGSLGIVLVLAIGAVAWWLLHRHKLPHLGGSSAGGDAA